MHGTPPVRRLRKKLEQDKQNQKLNLLWCLFGLVLIPGISGFYLVCMRLLNEVLSSLAIILLLSTLTLSISLVLLRDKFKVINKYLKDQNVTWTEVEDEVEKSEAFDEAVAELEKDKNS